MRWGCPSPKLDSKAFTISSAALFQPKCSNIMTAERINEARIHHILSGNIGSRTVSCFKNGMTGIVIMFAPEQFRYRLPWQPTDPDVISVQIKVATTEYSSGMDTYFCKNASAMQSFITNLPDAMASPIHVPPVHIPISKPPSVNFMIFPLCTNSPPRQAMLQSIFTCRTYHVPFSFSDTGFTPNEELSAKCHL